MTQEEAILNSYPASTESTPRSFDVIVIGAGPGGEDTTLLLLAAGLSVALVEKELIGGECFNWACVPSKAMLRPGNALGAAKRVPGAAEAVTGPVQSGAALAYRDEVVLHHDDTSEVENFTEAGAVFIRGRARLAGDRLVVVETAEGEHQLHATHAVILATGSTPALPSIPGLAEARPWTNREATSAKQAPKTLVVLGSGATGLELAQAWKTLGSERVVVLSRRSTLLPDHEPFVGQLLLDGLTAVGVEVRFESQIVEVRRAEDGRAHILLNDGCSLDADELLVATGKVPASAGLGLATVGVVDDGGFIAVGDDMTVGQLEWLYAIGDVNGRALFTHQASYHARIAADAIIARARGAISDFRDEANEVAVPQVIFTDPEVATVGLTLVQALNRGVHARRVETDMSTVLGAPLHAQGYHGRAALVVDDTNGTIVGATFVGQDVADMLHAATFAIVGRTPLTQLRHAIPSFPTLSELWVDLLAKALRGSFERHEPGELLSESDLDPDRHRQLRLN